MKKLAPRLMKISVFLSTFTAWATLAAATTIVVSTSSGAPEVPTTWRLRNHTSAPVVVTCTRDGSHDGTPITMASTRIPARSTTSYHWGDAYYADGLGLNAGTWDCRAGRSGKDLSPAGGFTTGWGEHVELMIQQQADTLTVKKLALHPDK